jgi:hypothetical protein
MTYWQQRSSVDWCVSRRAFSCSYPLVEPMVNPKSQISIVPTIPCLALMPSFDVRWYLLLVWPKMERLFLATAIVRWPPRHVQWVRVTMRKVSGSGLTIEEQHILEAGTGGTNNEIVSLDIRLSPNTVQTIGSVSHSWSSLVDAVMSSWLAVLFNRL